MIFVCDIKEKGDFCIQYQRKGWFLYAISKKRVFSVCDIKEKGVFYEYSIHFNSKLQKECL